MGCKRCKGVGPKNLSTKHKVREGKMGNPKTAGKRVLTLGRGKENDAETKE